MTEALAIAHVFAPLLARSAEGLRLSGPPAVWVVAGPLVAAVVAVFVAYWIERKTHGTGKWHKASRSINGMVVLAVVFVVIGVAATFNQRWTPTDDPARFHGVIAGPNYAVFDAASGETTAAAAATTVALEKIPRPAETFRIPDTHVFVPYFVDAWGRPMFVANGTLMSAGPDGKPGSPDDLPIPRPPQHAREK